MVIAAASLGGCAVADVTRPTLPPRMVPGEYCALARKSCGVDELSSARRHRKARRHSVIAEKPDNDAAQIARAMKLSSARFAWLTGASISLAMPEPMRSPRVSGDEFVGAPTLPPVNNPATEMQIAVSAEDELNEIDAAAQPTVKLPGAEIKIPRSYGFLLAFAAIMATMLGVAFWRERPLKRNRMASRCGIMAQTPQAQRRWRS